MPYRLTQDKKGVEEQKDGKWHVKKHYSGPTAEAKALAFLRALEINVEEAHGGED